MKKLSIAAKFNLVFLAVSAVGFIGASVVTDFLLKRNAREETLQNARLLIQSSAAARTYTSAQIVPLLENRLKFEFLPQSITSFAATEQLNQLLKDYPGFSYKEATLNPTNLRNKASDWEAPLVHQLRANPALTEMVGERETPNGRALYVARPNKVTEAACLACHSVPDAAPKTMLDIYGREHGFGWKLGEIIGARVVSVPMDVPLKRAREVLHTYMLAMLGVFAFLFVTLNVMVHLFVTRRLTQLTRVADEVSLGKFDAADLDTRGGDELAQLARSFSRMRTSLSSAMKMLDE